MAAFKSSFSTAVLLEEASQSRHAVCPPFRRTWASLRGQCGQEQSGGMLWEPRSRGAQVSGPWSPHWVCLESGPEKAGSGRKQGRVVGLEVQAVGHPLGKGELVLWMWVKLRSVRMPAGEQSCWRREEMPLPRGSVSRVRRECRGGFTGVGTGVPDLPPQGRQCCLPRLPPPQMQGVPAALGSGRILCDLANWGDTVAAFQGRKKKVTSSYETSILVL